MINKLKEVVGELYSLYGATTQVVKLSEILDNFVLEEQENKGECEMDRKQENEMLKIAFKQAKHEYDLLEMYYQLAKDYIDELEEQLDELASENIKIKQENEQLQVKNAILQGENNNIKNRLRMITGRENR